MIDALEKYGEAMRVLAAHPGDAQARLYHVLHHLVVVTPETVSGDFRADIEWMRRKLALFMERKPGKYGSYKIWQNPKRNKLAAEIATRVVGIEGRLRATKEARV